MNTKQDSWVLYTLEDPIIRHNGKLRKCRVSMSGINPLNVYNDETQKLTYSSTNSTNSVQQIHRREIRAINAFEEV